MVTHAPHAKPGNRDTRLQWWVDLDSFLLSATDPIVMVVTSAHLGSVVTDSVGAEGFP